MSKLLDDLDTLGWSLPSSGFDSGEVDYPEAARSALDEIEDRSPWFVARNGVIEDLLQRGGGAEALVEVGAGNGTVAAHLERCGLDVLAVEPSELGAANCRRRGLTTVAATLQDLQLPGRSVPAVGCFDVLEHLGDPRPLVEEVHRVLAPGGLFLVTVPAFAALWSQVDEVSGHHRRYRTSSLDDLVRPAGFVPVARSYYFSTGVPYSLAFRALPYRAGRRHGEDEVTAAMADELDPSGRLAPALVHTTAAVERRLIRRGRSVPFGSSLGAVYVKRSGLTPTIRVT